MFDEEQLACAECALSAIKHSIAIRHPLRMYLRLSWSSETGIIMSCIREKICQEDKKEDLSRVAAFIVSVFQAVIVSVTHMRVVIHRVSLGL